MLGELNEYQMNNVLVSQAVGRLACCSRGKPYIVPVTYAFDGTYIYGQSVPGMKLDILRKNPQVCFQVDMMTDMTNWQSVVLWGKFEELKGKEAHNARNYLYNRVMPLMTSSTVHPYGHSDDGEVEDKSRIKPVVYRIKIEKKTGRFEKQ